MPGLFGAVAVDSSLAIEPTDAKVILASMSEVLAHTGQHCELWSDSSSGAYVGRVGPDKFNTVPWAGESNFGGHRAWSFVAGSLLRHPPADSDDRSGIAKNFIEEGSQFLDKLQGPFTVLAHAKFPRETVIAVDRCAHIPLFYALHNGVLYFAPEIKALLCVPGLPLSRSVRRALR